MSHYFIVSSMKWIKTLSARVRRGDDSSPSRRSLKRKASSPGSLTDQASLGSVEYCGKGRGAPAPANATWKIGMLSTAFFEISSSREQMDTFLVATVGARLTHLSPLLNQQRIF